MTTSYYSTGTVTLTNGSATVTGTGTAWQTALIAGGNVFVQAPGNPLPIATVDSETQITAELQWTGATGTYVYRIQRDTAYLKTLDVNSAALSSLLADISIGRLGLQFAAQGRLTLQSGVAVPSTDQTAKTTVYFTPYLGSQIGLYANGAWAPYAFTETALSLSGFAAAKPYDIFGYANAGTLALEALVWTNDTTRATGLVLQNGVLVKSGSPTRRYLGTIYTSATGQCEDSLAKRYVWNANNRRPRPMAVLEATDSWTYTTDAWRQSNGNAANQLDYVAGLAEDAVSAIASSIANTGSSSAVRVQSGIGVDSATAHSGVTGVAQLSSSIGAVSFSAAYDGIPGVGRHTLKWLERSAASGTTTWHGDFGLTDRQSGILGTVFG